MSEYIIKDSAIASIGETLKDRSKFIPSVQFSNVPNILRNNFNRPEEHYKYYGISEDRSSVTNMNRTYEIECTLGGTYTWYDPGDGEAHIDCPVYLNDVYIEDENGEFISVSLPDGNYTFIANQTVLGTYETQYYGTDLGHNDAYAVDSGSCTITTEGDTYTLTVNDGVAKIFTEVYGYSAYWANDNGVEFIDSVTITITPNVSDYFSFIATGTEEITTTKYILKFSSLDISEADLRTKTIRTAASESAEIVNYTSITTANAIELTTSKLYPNGWYYINYESPKAFDYVEFRVMFDGQDMGVCCHAKVTLPKNLENSIICYPDIYGRSVFIPKGTIQATVYPIENNQLRVELNGRYKDTYGNTVVL